MKTYLRKIVAFINDEEAASAIEYALLLVMIALAIIGVASHPWPQDRGVFSRPSIQRWLPLNKLPRLSGRGRSLRASAPALPGKPVLPSGGDCIRGMRP